MDKAITKPLQDPPEGYSHSISPVPTNPIATPPNTSISDDLKNKDLLIESATPVEYPKEFPWNCNGKLFFTWKKKDYVGSAGSILRQVLLTAGHNIFDEGEWSDNFYFYPGYTDKNDTGYGWSRASIFTAWQNAADYAYDYGMILTSSEMPTSIGVIRNLSPKGRTWTAIGYPAEAPYNGISMQETTGKYVSGSRIITMDNNDMTKGSSGGNWVINLVDKPPYVNGIQSTRGGTPTQANSPYIDDSDYQKVLDCVSTGTCK